MQTATVLVRCNGEVELRDYEAARNFMASLNPVPEIATELLPPGPWPKQEAIAESPERTAAKQFLDHSRLSFLLGLGQVEMRVVGVRTLGNRRYEGVVVRTSTGKSIALLDCPLLKNALYAFDAEVPDWMEVAKLTKHEIYASRPAAFIRIFRHQGNWQGRVIDFLRG